MPRGVEWDQLKTPDIKAAWSASTYALSKKLSSPEVLAEDYMCVPRIEEAPYYDLMVCFSRPNPKSFSKIFSKEYDFRLHGHLTDIVNNLIDYTKLLNLCKNPISGDLNKKEFIFKEEHGDKSVEIKLEGLTKEVINWAGISKGHLILDLEKVDLEGRRTVYMISEVIYASKVTIKASVGSSSKKDTLTRKLPVAFSYTKFPVSTDGVMKEAKDMDRLDRSASFAPA